VERGIFSKDEFLEMGQPVGSGDDEGKRVKPGHLLLGLQKYFDLPIHFKAYLCLFFRQNG
jgi:hypothetical protein